MALKPIALNKWAILATLLLAGQVMASPAHGDFGVSAQVVRAHQPALANLLPLPLPGHVMQEDARGRHYVFEGTLATARAFYADEMRKRGFLLVQDNTAGALASDLRFQRKHEVTLVQMEGTAELGLTRIDLLAMSE